MGGRDIMLCQVDGGKEVVRIEHGNKVVQRWTGLGRDGMAGGGWRMSL